MGNLRLQTDRQDTIFAATLGCEKKSVDIKEAHATLDRMIDTFLDLEQKEDRYDQKD